MNLESDTLRQAQWRHPFALVDPSIRVGRIFLDKRTKITEAAASCFVRLGYAETSMDEIVAQSGVVKQTIYNHFANKDEVFKAAIEYLLSSASYEFDASLYKANPTEFFEKVGKLQLKSLADPKTVDFLHLLVKECRRYPDLQQVYAESIPKPFIDFVGGYIFTRQGSEDYTPDELSMAQSIAWCFRSALTGFATLNNLLPLMKYPLPNRTAFLQMAADMFARLIGVEQQLTDEKNRTVETRAESTPAEFFAPQVQRLGQKKVVIIEAALRVLSERGFADASMDEIANVAKVSKQTVYKHFRSKSYLFSFISKSIVEELQSLPLPSDKLALPEYLEEYCNSLIQQCRQSWLRDYFRLIFGEARSFPAESAALLIFMMDHGREQLEAKIRSAFPGADVDYLAVSMLIRSVVGGYILLNQIYVVADNPYLNEQTLVQIANGLLQGIR